MSSIDLVKLRDILCSDVETLLAWPRVVDGIVKTPSAQIEIKRLVLRGERAEIEEGVLKSLQAWETEANKDVDFLQELRAAGLNTTADKIQSQRGLVPTKQTIFFQMGQAVHNFIGRKAELGLLHKKLTGDRSSDSILGNIASISGLGGVGKTTLAKKYGFNHRDDFEGNVLFIKAETSASMRDSFTSLSIEIGIPVADGANDEDIVAPIFDHFATRKCLFIFDNAENAETLKKFMPRSIRSNHVLPYILVTTLGDYHVASPKRQLKLGVFPAAESFELIRDQLEEADENSVHALGKKLGYHPLALQQALAYIREDHGDHTNCIGEYLEEFNNQARTLLEDEKFRTMHEYERSTFTTWNLTLGKITARDGGELAIKLINLLAYLDPEQISLEFVLSTGVVSQDKKVITNRLNLLQKYSMAERVPRNGRTMMRIHRLVQHVIRLDLNSRGEEGAIVVRVAATISKQFKKDEFTIDTKECMWHGLHLYPCQEQHFETTMKQNWDYVSRVCFYLTQYGNYDDSIAICKQASALYGEKNGETHESTIQMKWKLAGTYSRMGKHDECLAILEPLYPVAKDALGARHWIACTISALKAATYTAKGSLHEVVAMYDEVIRTMNAAMGRDEESDRDAATRVLYYKHCKADALLALKRFDEALDLAQDVYDQRVKLFGTKDDARCFYVLKLVGQVWYEKGKLKKAAVVWTQVHEGFEKLFGPDNVRAQEVMKDIEMVNREIEVGGRGAGIVE